MELRHHIDSRRPALDPLDQLHRQFHAHARAFIFGGLNAIDSFLRDEHTRHLIVQEGRVPYADQRQDARQDGFIQRAVYRLVLLQQLRPVIRAVDRLRQEEVRAVGHLAVQGLDLALQVGRAQVERRAHEESRRLADAGS